ncbi:energy transducer TonB [Urechidicola croceus]|uniref:TonB C-terminal domain-containing protein n=1 Tax=Urechidicola croceus TaxID=1850246 RepID=A0A1D8P6Y1_9FLAO|nr:energy transducer TonB [Urechidicola croceus]AOW20333.1 hypothetical protein LPB138_06410 [Urechidicola croceus]
MKKSIVIFVTILLTQVTISQNFQSVEEVNSACVQLGFSSNQEAEITVDRILSKIGLFRNFIVQECPDINNAVAKNVKSKTGETLRYILYDNEFFNNIDNKASNNWASISILAHEIAHHLNGHALNNKGSNHKFELEADYSSGFYLAKMGATLQEAQSAINTLRYEKATHTHPAKLDRLNSIKKGWEFGSKEVKINKEKKESGEIEEEVPFSVIEEVPTFPGCKGTNQEKKKCLNKSFRTHIGRNFNADIANDLGLQSTCLETKEVYDAKGGSYISKCVKFQPIKILAQFKISKNGEVIDIGIRAPHPGLQEETKRVLNLLPKMEPGYQRGKAVNVPYALPISFIVTD